MEGKVTTASVALCWGEKEPDHIDVEEDEEEREWNGRVGMGLVVVRSRGRGCMSRSGFKYELLWKLYGWYGRVYEEREM